MPILHRTSIGRRRRQARLKQWGWRIVGFITINAFAALFVYCLLHAQP